MINYLIYRRGAWLRNTAILFVISVIVLSCSQITDDTLFEKIPADDSNIHFSNDLAPDASLNFLSFPNFYSGGGVALGDINNDGLVDIYLVANRKSNRLYLNKGDFEFEDITEKAGVGGSKPWSTGVSMADVNGDGWLDIYVSNSAVPQAERRRNELFVNNGDPSGDGQAPTFTEQASEYGIADSGSSIQSAFFDYDRDGDLDMYLLNYHNSIPIGRYNLRNNRRGEINFRGGDRLYRNELIKNEGADTAVSEGTSTPRFVDVTEEAGLYSSEIGFGLGVSVGDVNRDGWMDIYISNDFFERDYLYYNNGDGTFREVLEDKLRSISTTSMGGDIADLDNDRFPEIFISDMLPDTEERLKTITDFIGWEEYRSEVEMGYHHKFTRNTLHYNNGDGTFSEIGRYAGVEASDWSWGALMADFNLDGFRDIFVPNGIYEDETNKDYLLSATRPEVMRKVVVNNRIDINKLAELIPTVPVSNLLFENGGDLQFSNRAMEWGLSEPGFSNGSAYGDLDNDGDLDLVVNNVNMAPYLYRNRAAELNPRGSWLQVELKGQPPNTLGIGAQVEVTVNGRRWYAEQMPQRGFQSSVDPVLHLGLGDSIATVDTLEVWWPGGNRSLLTGVETRRQVVVRETEAGTKAGSPIKSPDMTSETGLMEDVTGEYGLPWRHEESDFNDFSRSPLLFHMRSTEGPPVCGDDLNGDGRTDFYIGGGAGQAGALFLQSEDGNQFIRISQPALEADRGAEDSDCLFLDADGDGRPELYVGSGSSEFVPGDQNLADRLYRVGDNYRLTRLEDALPRPRDGHMATGVVRAADLDGDGDQDLFAGTRLAVPYGTPAGGFLLLNDGEGRFEDATDSLAPGLGPGQLGTAGITDAEWADMDGDGTPDLVVAGEWMPLTIFYNRDGKLERDSRKDSGLEHTGGWWLSLALEDLDGDGRIDLVAGNHGLNSRFRAAPGQPLEMWVSDFDRNGSVEQIFSRFADGKGPYPVALRHNILVELPYLNRRFPTYADYAGSTISDIFDGEQLSDADHYRVEQLASVVAWNRGGGSFRVESLPFRAQLAPMYAVMARDLDGNGKPELLMGGNLYGARPQAGPYDASYGVVLSQDQTGRYVAVPSTRSGFSMEGEIRDFQLVVSGGQTLILVSRNDGPVQLFRVRDSNVQ